MRRAAKLGYAALALTDECSVAGVVRAHRAAKEAGLPLIVGTELALDPATRVVLLAPDRAAYGRLSALITRARRSAEKGGYRLEPEHLGEGVEGCLALLIFGLPVFRRLARGALSGAPVAGGDAAPRAGRCRRSGGAPAPRPAARPAPGGGGRGADAREDAPAAGRYPERDPSRLPGVGARLRDSRQRGVPPAFPPAARPDLSPRPAGRERLARLAVSLLARRAALRVSRRARSPRAVSPGVPAPGDRGGHPEPLAGGGIPRGESADRARARPHRRASLRALLPDRARHRALRARARDPLPGTGLGRELLGVLLPRHHRGGPPPA